MLTIIDLMCHSYYMCLKKYLRAYTYIRIISSEIPFERPPLLEINLSREAIMFI